MRQCSNCGKQAENSNVMICSNCGGSFVEINSGEVNNVCPACGNAMIPGSEFCSVCGHSATGRALVPDDAVYGREDIYARKTSSRSSGNKMMILIVALLSVFIVLVAALIAVTVINNNSEETVEVERDNSEENNEEENKDDEKNVKDGKADKKEAEDSDGDKDDENSPDKEDAENKKEKAEKEKAIAEAEKKKAEEEAAAAKAEAEAAAAKAEAEAAKREAERAKEERQRAEAEKQAALKAEMRSEIESAVDGYVRSFVNALNYGDSSYMIPYTIQGQSSNNVYKTQSSFIYSGVYEYEEYVDSYVTGDIKIESDNLCVVSVYEIYNVKKPGESYKRHEQTATYRMKKDSYGDWKVYEFVGKVQTH